MTPRYITPRGADVTHHGQVVGDKKVSQAEFLLQVFQQVDHLRLDGNIQGGDGLIADDQIRVEARARATPMRWRCPPENSCG